MANRIVGNVIIVDSAMGNASIISPGTGNFNRLYVNAIAFWSLDTTGACTLSEANTTDVLVRFSWMSNGAGASTNPSVQARTFASPQSFSTLKVPSLTAGTAWIYLA